MLSSALFVFGHVRALIATVKMPAHFMLLGIIASFVANAAAYCECGYSTEISVGSVPNTYIFTDVIESDFFHIKNVEIDSDWSIQNYNISASAARGPYG
jgi:hypothetical protein